MLFMIHRRVHQHTTTHVRLLLDIIFILLFIILTHGCKELVKNLQRSVKAVIRSFSGVKTDGSPWFFGGIDIIFIQVVMFV